MVAKIYLLDLKASLADELCGASRCEKADLMMYETLGKIEKSSLIIYGQNGYIIPMGSASRRNNLFLVICLELAHLSYETGRIP